MIGWVSELVAAVIGGFSGVVVEVDATTDSSVVGNPPAAEVPFVLTPGVGAAATTEVSVVGNGAFSPGEGDALGEAATSACG